MTHKKNYISSYSNTIVMQIFCCVVPSVVESYPICVSFTSHFIQCLTFFSVLLSSCVFKFYHTDASIVSYLSAILIDFLLWLPGIPFNSHSFFFTICAIHACVLKLSCAFTWVICIYPFVRNFSYQLYFSIPIHISPFCITPPYAFS